MNLTSLLINCFLAHQNRKITFVQNKKMVKKIIYLQEILGLKIQCFFFVIHRNSAS